MIGGDGGTYGGNEPTLLDPCNFGSSFAGDVATASLAVSTVSQGTAFQAYSYDLASQSAVVRWGPDTTPTSVLAWVCLDSVPAGRRVAAMNLAGGFPEVFLTSAGGWLFVRREKRGAIWLDWTPFSLPLPGAQLTDVAAVGGSLSRVYIVDRGQVFVRAKVSEATYADYGPWRALPANDAQLLAAIKLENGAHQVLVSTRGGTVMSAKQEEGAASFGPWSGLPPLPKVVDLDAQETTAQRLGVFALDLDGNVWAYWYDSDAGWALQPRGPGIVAISAPLKGSDTFLVGLDARGGLHRLGAVGWSAVAPWN